MDATAAAGAAAPAPILTVIWFVNNGTNTATPKGAAKIQDSFAVAVTGLKQVGVYVGLQSQGKVPH